jgi:hypothetical protein
MRGSVLVFALLASAAWAEPLSVRLVFMRSAGAEGCPAEERLRGAVTERLGTDPFSLQAPNTAIVEFSGKGRSLRALITFQSTDGVVKRRELTSPTLDCTELFRSVELALAIAIDPHAALVTPSPAPSSAPPSPSPPPPPPPSTAPEPPVPQPSIPQQPPANPWLAVGGPGVYATAGLGPTASAGVSLLGGLRRGWLGLELQGRIDLPSSLPVSRGTVVVNAFVASVGVCLRGNWWGACMLGAGGALRVNSNGLARVAQSTAGVAGAGSRVFVQVAMGRWLAIRLALDLEVQLAPTTVLVSDRPVWTSAPVVGLLGVQLLVVPW